MRMIVIYVENANTVHMKTQFTLSCLNEFKACCHLKFYGCSISAAQCEIFHYSKIVDFNCRELLNRRLVSVIFLLNIFLHSECVIISLPNKILSLAEFLSLSEIYNSYSVIILV